MLTAITGVSSGTLRLAVEYGLPFSLRTCDAVGGGKWQQERRGSTGKACCRHPHSDAEAGRDERRNSARKCATSGRRILTKAALQAAPPPPPKKKFPPDPEGSEPQPNA